MSPTLPLPALTPELTAAVDAVREAARLADTLQREMCAAVEKADRSPVTVADFAVQALVTSRLADSPLGGRMVAEEESLALWEAGAGSLAGAIAEAVSRAGVPLTREELLEVIDRGRGTPAGRFWTLDPIDGTRGFLRGGQFAVALALVEDGQPVFGVVACPRLEVGPGVATELSPALGHSGGSLLVARRGHGTWSSPLAGGAWTRLGVSTCGDPNRARLSQSVEARHMHIGRTAALIKALGCEIPPRPMDSQAKHAALATGATDFIVRIPARDDYRETIWDHAAGTLIVEEAGGRVTDVHGEPFDFTTGRRLTGNFGLLASNGRIHAAVVRILDDVLA